MKTNDCMHIHTDPMPRPPDGGETNKKHPENNVSRCFLSMPMVGVEPTRYHYQWILSPHRLPFRHIGSCLERSYYSRLQR